MLIAVYTTQTEALNRAEKDQLIYLLKQDCGSCHGLTLKGGLGPALLKKDLQGKPQSYLESVIANGRAGTPMPPWKNILKPEQIEFLASYLLSEKNVAVNQTPENSFELNMDRQATKTSAENL